MKKKITLWLLTLVLATMSIFALVACGSNAGPNYAGTYKFYSMTVGGVTLKAGENWGVIALSENVITLKLKDDGTFTISAADDLVESGDGQWKVNENDSKKIDLTIEGATQTWNCDGKEISFSQSSMGFSLSFVLRK